jgi:CheY-like chemotaxis protein
MMKKILIAQNEANVDRALQRSLAHLAKSCQITTVHDGYRALEEIGLQAFDLVIMETDLSDVDSLEVVEGIQYIDPGVPTIVILSQPQPELWSAIRNLEAHPIVRPFKPLRFLRLVDRLLHQQLNQYRQLADRLTTILAELCSQTKAPYGFLVSGSGQVMISSSETEPISPEWLGQLVVNSLTLDEEFWELPKPDEVMNLAYLVKQNYGLYLAFVAENLHLALISAGADDNQGAPETWQQVQTAANQAKAALDDQLHPDLVPSGRENTSLQIYTPLNLNVNNELNPPDQAHDQIRANWDLINYRSDVLSRLDDFCRVQPWHEPVETPVNEL